LGKGGVARRNALLARQLALLDEAVVVSCMALDPVVASGWRVRTPMQHQPPAAEVAGKLRGHGTAMRARATFGASHCALIAGLDDGRSRVAAASCVASRRAWRRPWARSRPPAPARGGELA
jgi:hypothetical protein